jgi:exoribonuclease R
MEFIVQIRGGKAVLVNSDGAPDGPRLTDHCWIAGDRVSSYRSLIHRTPMNAIGVVKRFTPTGVHIVFPAHPAFQTILPIKQRLVVGDRVIIHLDAVGRVHVLGCFSGEAADDAAVVRRAYTPVTAAALPAVVDVTTPAYTTPGRVDHTDLDVFTVDPESSVDLDDAITLDPVNRLLYVHIVDIHAGLKDAGGAAVETRMFQNACTLYLANEYTDHLLPAAAVEAMSLNVGVPRRAITVKMTLCESDGSIETYEIYPSTICVKRRLSYKDLDVSCTPYNWLHRLACVKSDMITLCIPGLELQVGPGGLLEHVLPVETNDAAHRFIAFAMIAANCTVSAHLHRRGIKVPNRFHEQIAGVRESEVERVTGHPTVDSFLALKKWRGARYDLDARGHFGLGLTDYVHFTSPMRRYADVLVHNLLAGVVYDTARLRDAVELINAQALHAKGLQRYYSGLKIARYVTATVPPEVVITGISPAGVQWYEPILLINGFTHVSAIGDGTRWFFEAGILKGDGCELCVGSTVAVDRLDYDFSTGVYAARLK